jgi:hypothetical protein
LLFLLAVFLLKSVEGLRFGLVFVLLIVLVAPGFEVALSTTLAFVIVV